MYYDSPMSASGCIYLYVLRFPHVCFRFYIFICITIPPCLLPVLYIYMYYDSPMSASGSIYLYVLRFPHVCFRFYIFICITIPPCLLPVLYIYMYYKLMYYHSVKSTLSFFETFPPIKLLQRTIVVVCHFKSI